jgi:hypothetical protein
MKKILSILLILTAIFILSSNNVHASLLVVKPNGSLQVNVLSAENETSLTPPEHTNLQIERVGSGSISDASIVKLKKSDGKINLQVYGNSGVDNLNVTGYKENILEVEERPDTQKLEVSLSGNDFRIKNKGTTALTAFPITVDSKTADLSISTDTGDKILAVYPFDAMLSALRTKLITNVNRNNLEIIVENDKLIYKVQGEKSINIYNLYTYLIPVYTYISATTGEVVRIDAPGWLKIVNFLFA